MPGRRRAGRLGCGRDNGINQHDQISQPIASPGYFKHHLFGFRVRGLRDKRLASQLVVYEARQGLWTDRALNSPIRPQPGMRAMRSYPRCPQPLQG
jgi:hypothetical protein